MKNIKTYEGFLDFFKSKKGPAKQNSLVEECISEVKDLHLLKSEISRTIKTSKGEIQHNTSLIWLEKPYIVKYKLNVDESRTDRQKELFSNLLIIKCATEENKFKWTDEQEKEWLENGAAKKNDYEIYRLNIDDKPVKADAELLEQLFNAIDNEFYYTTGLYKRYTPTLSSKDKDDDDDKKKNKRDDDGDFARSAALGYLTDNPLLGGALGGNFAGGLLGSSFNESKIKLFESWSEDYTYGFTDKGFEVKEEGQTIFGKYKGKFVMTELTDEFTEMISKLSDNYYILKSQTYFNQTTGGASFNVTVSDKFIENTEFISFRMDAGNLEFYPNKVTGIQRYTMYLSGRLKSGAQRLIAIDIEDGKIKVIIRGFANRRCQLDLEMANKLFTLIENGSITKNDPEDYYPQFKAEVLQILEK